MDALELIGLLIEFRQSVAGAVHNSEDLRHWKEEVNQLRDEEKHHSLGEVTKNSADGESHSSHVAECVPNKSLRWESVVLEEGKSAEEEWNYDGQWIGMVLNGLSGNFGVNPMVKIDFHDVVDHNEAAHDEALSNFDTVNTSVNVDGVSAEYGYVSHINVVQNTKVYVTTKKWS